MLTSVLKGDLGDSHSIRYHLISFAGEYMCVHVSFSLLFYSKHIIIIILAIKKSLVFKVLCRWAHLIEGNVFK